MRDFRWVLLGFVAAVPLVVLGCAGAESDKVESSPASVDPDRGTGDPPPIGSTEEGATQQPAGGQ